MTSWEFRPLNQPKELSQVAALESRIWGLPERELIPSSLLRALSYNGGLVAGAFDGADLIGVAVAFPVLRGKKALLWSYMAGVHPDYQGQGVGYDLKHYQRAWALEHGFLTMAWTFDPLQSGNANFNLHRLGTTASIYHENFYGSMEDAINAGLPSDRLEVTWNLRSRRTRKSEPVDAAPAVLPSVESFLLWMSERQTPRASLNFGEYLPEYYAEIPRRLGDLRAVDSSQPYQWRLALRQALTAAFSAGYVATDFQTAADRCWYVLSLPPAWYLYVLECHDSSLYTGITPDVQRRLRQHNAGRGAAYTANRRPVRLIASWRFLSRSDALKAERAFKKQSRAAKLALIARQSRFHDAPFISPEEHAE